MRERQARRRGPETIGPDPGATDTREIYFVLRYICPVFARRRGNATVVDLSMLQSAVSLMFADIPNAVLKFTLFI